MFFRALDLLPIEEEIYLLSLDIPVIFFFDWQEKMDRNMSSFCTGICKKKEE